MTLNLDLAESSTVACRAACRLGAETVSRMLADDGRCCRAVASDRLFIRRYAQGQPAPGEVWSYRDHLDLIDAELTRMGVSGEEAAGCRRADCPICTAVPRSTPSRVRRWLGWLLRFVSRFVR